MTQVIDLRLDFPPSVDEIVKPLKFMIVNRHGRGVANYRRIFGPRWAAATGVSLEELEKMAEKLSDEQLDAFLREKASRIVLSLPEFEKQLDEAGIQWGLLPTMDNETMARQVAQLPGRVFGNTAVDPKRVMAAVGEVERAITQFGFKCINVSAYRTGIKANDARFYPVYAKAVELNVPVMIYATMNYNTELPMDIGRPLYLDRVAMDFPELKIIASCGGWPWVNELVGVARRHPNIYIDTSEHRPKYLTKPGWEMLLQFANSVLQDQMVFGSGWGDLGIPVGQIVKEMRALPLKDAVKEKWLYRNAARLFNMG